MTTVASWPDVVATANCVLPLPDVVQPATKRIATKMVVPSNRADTPPRLNRKLLNIAAILFGLTRRQEWRNETELTQARTLELFDPNDRLQLYSVYGKLKSMSLGNC